MYNIINKRTVDIMVYYCILLNNAMVKCTEKEGSGMLGGGIMRSHSRETRTFVLKPLPNKDITV